MGAVGTIRMVWGQLPTSHWWVTEAKAPTVWIQKWVSHGCGMPQPHATETISRNITIQFSEKKKEEEEEENNLPETFVLQENIKFIFSINSSWYHFYSFLNSGSSCAVKWVDIEIVQFPHGFSWTSLMGILNLYFLKEENGKTMRHLMD